MTDSTDVALEAVCIDCREPYGSPRFPDLIIDHDAWRKISPDGDGNGLLCPNCINARLRYAGLENVSAKFTSGPMAALPKGELAERLLEAEAELRDGPYSSDLIKTVRQLMRAAAMALGARLPEGYSLVPKYPTDEMWLAFFSCNAQRGEDGMAEFHYWEGDFGNFAASYHAMLEAADLRADASLLVGGVPEGYVLVPKEPTHAMAVAGARKIEDDRWNAVNAAAGCYKAMITAARPPESGRE